MNRGIDRLQTYPFPRLANLVAGIDAPEPVIPLSIGEPRHAPPASALEPLTDPASLAAGLGRYPPTLGTPELKAALRRWLTGRYGLEPTTLADEALIPVTGTREALFALAHCFVDACAGATVLMPNPFYQIYEGAALLAGAEPVYVPTPATTDFRIDLDAIDEADLERCALFYVCAPGNPCGATMALAHWQQLVELADRHDFVIASDECYSEIYDDETSPPMGLLEACRHLGRDDYDRCIVLNSLSKRSNLPGLRSGFVAGDARRLARFGAYRTYHGCGMPLPSQAASVIAWSDEAHVAENRARYREKFDAVVPILARACEVTRPPAGFFLWPRVPDAFAGDDEAFTRALYEATGVLTLPGRYLSRPPAAGRDPGAGHVRIALVAPIDQCVEAAQRIEAFVAGEAR